MMSDLLPFNSWSKKRILDGRKCCTSRHKKYSKDTLVKIVSPPETWGYIRNNLYVEEGADSPEELQQVIEDIMRRPVPDDELFYVHWFDNSKMQERLR